MLWVMIRSVNRIKKVPNPNQLSVAQNKKMKKN